MKTIIHVNQHIIRANKKHGRTDPPVTVRQDKKITRCMEVHFEGNAKIVYRPNNPLSCGARLWIETFSPVVIKQKKPRSKTPPKIKYPWGEEVGVPNATEIKNGKN